MSSVVISGDTSGTCTLQAPAVAGSTVLTLPASTGTVLTSVSPQSSFPPNIAGNGPAFSAYANATQNMTNATFTLVALNTELFDTNNNFNNTTYTFTPTVAGYYQISATVMFATTGGNILSNCIASLFKNGAEFSRGGAIVNTTATLGQTNCVASDLIYMNGTTDYLQLYAYAISAGTPQIAYFNTSYTSRMSAFLARGA